LKLPKKILLPPDPPGTLYYPLADFFEGGSQRSLYQHPGIGFDGNFKRLSGDEHYAEIDFLIPIKDRITG
jgi:hypothetical protein